MTEGPAETEKRFKDACFRLHFYEKHIHAHSLHARRPSQLDMRIVHAHHLSGTARRFREALPPLVLVGPLSTSLQSESPNFQVVSDHGLDVKRLMMLVARGTIGDIRCCVIPGGVAKYLAPR